MVQPSIPQDIIDHIVESVPRHDTYLLRICTLVSRSFLYPSHKQLFADISLGTQEQCLALLDVLVKHPYIQSYVKILEINSPTSSWRYSNLNEITKTIDEILYFLSFAFRCALSKNFGSSFLHTMSPPATS
jgi:hypothetical protein